MPNAAAPQDGTIDGEDTNYYYRMPSTTLPSSASTTPRITLTRFLSHAVKDNPDVRIVKGTTRRKIHAQSVHPHART
jgi:hypothetical protein